MNLRQHKRRACAGMVIRRARAIRRLQEVESYFDGDRAPLRRDAEMTWEWGLYSPWILRLDGGEERGRRQFLNMDQAA